MKKREYRTKRNFERDFLQIGKQPRLEQPAKLECALRGLEINGWGGWIRTNDDGVRVRGLTTWRHPSNRAARIYKSGQDFSP